MTDEKLKDGVYEIELDILAEAELTPNQWVLLNIIYNKDEVAYIRYFDIGRHDILRDDLYTLYKKDYMINDGVTNWTFKFPELHISEKGLNLINKEEKLTKRQIEFDDFMNKYYNSFPEKVHTGNLLVRSNLKLCKSKMISFIKEYKYDYDTILKATEMYIKISKTNGYNYMKTAYYFIKKDAESILDSYCQEVLSKPKDSETEINSLFKEL